MSIEIRRIRREEAASVARLWDQMGVELPDGSAMTPEEKASIQGMLTYSATDDKAFCLVASADEQLIGFVNGELRSDDGPLPGVTGEIETLYVMPSTRRRGVGSALVKAAVTWLRERDANPLSLETWLDDEEVKAFWSSLGFEPESLRMTLYQDDPVGQTADNPA